MNNTLRTYRTAAAEGATHIGLLIATYDSLAEDLRLAGEAAESGNIAVRCAHSQHALLLLGHLESWVPLLDEAVLQESLVRFYSYVRYELLRLQGAPEKSHFALLSLRICEIRAAWQQKQSQSSISPTPVTLPAPEVLLPDPVIVEGESRFCWSA